jgi:hypothetical protein
MAGEWLMREGETSEHLFLLKSGQCELVSERFEGVRVREREREREKERERVCVCVRACVYTYMHTYTEGNVWI